MANQNDESRKQIEAENEAAKGDNRAALQGRTPSNAAGQPNIDPTQNNARPLGERPKGTIRNEFKLGDGSGMDARANRVAESFSVLLQDLEGQMTGSPEHREMVDKLREAFFWALAAGAGGGTSTQSQPSGTTAPR